jgi:hypothetical protein
MGRLGCGEAGEDLEQETADEVLATGGWLAVPRWLASAAAPARGSPGGSACALSAQQPSSPSSPLAKPTTPHNTFANAVCAGVPYAKINPTLCRRLAPRRDARHAQARIG